MKKSRAGIFLAVIPSVIMLGLYYSLAIHIRQSLGAWPTGIGERGFPPSLLAHVGVTVDFYLLFLSSILISAIAILVGLLVQRWQRFVPYFALNGLLWFICLYLMRLAPEPFLNWWRD